MYKEFIQKKPIKKIIYRSRYQTCLTRYVNKRVTKKLFWLIPYKTYPPGIWEHDFRGSDGYMGSVEDYNKKARIHNKVILDYSNGEPELVLKAYLELYFEGEEQPVKIYENENGYTTLVDYLEDLKLYHPEIDQLINYETLDAGINI